MSIGNESRQAPQHAALTGADDLAGALAVGPVVWDVVRPITILRIGALITTVVNSAANAVVAFHRRILTDSDAGMLLGLDGTAILAGNGVLQIPTTTAVGKIVYKEVRVDVNPGDQIAPFLTTAATVAGGARYFFEYINRHETPANCADMVKSA